MKGLGLAGGGKRVPRRSQTHCNYALPTPVTMQMGQPPRISEETSDGTPAASASPDGQGPLPRPTPVTEKTLARRPALGRPRRSYSVMDSDPEPQVHRLSTRLTLTDMPSELHYAIFDFLDAIDSTCLGLTNKHFYSIHRRMHGIVPLSTRRDGPNELEWAWHLAGATVQNSLAAVCVAATTSQQNALAKLRVRGQGYCRKCGITRCELHKHIQGWMGDDHEYCTVKQRFGPVAPDGAKPYCYMRKPADPHRCGRHRKHASKVILK